MVATYDSDSPDMLVRLSLKPMRDRNGVMRPFFEFTVSDDDTAIQFGSFSLRQAYRGLQTNAANLLTGEFALYVETQGRENIGQDKQTNDMLFGDEYGSISYGFVATAQDLPGVVKRMVQAFKAAYPDMAWERLPDDGRSAMRGL